MAKDNDRFAIFLAGLGIGVIGTLLLAPLSGADARTRIKRGAGKANDYLKDGTTALVDQAGEAIDELTEETKCELDNVAAAARKAIGKVPGINSEFVLQVETLLSVIEASPIQNHKVASLSPGPIV